MTERQPRVELVPWDHDSSEHIERMYLQRLGCGWRSEEVREKWTQLGREGTKTLYWIVGLPAAVDLQFGQAADRARLTGRPGRPGRSRGAHNPAPRREPQGKQTCHKRPRTRADPKIRKPQESSPIHDTAPTHWSEPRTPRPSRAFTPIGHIALDLRPEQNARLGLADAGVVWVAGLYVSYALQAGGLGREVMDLAEGIAVRPPLGGRWVVLDTMTREQQLSSAFVERVYLAQGKPAPKVAIQDWYERQGYEIFDKWAAGYQWVNPETGEREDIDYLFLRKRLQ